MEQPPRRTWLIKLIVVKKAFFSLVLLAISLAAGWSWRNYESLAIWADNNLVDAEYKLVQYLMNFVLNSDIDTLRTIARISGVYGLILAIATVGFWYHKRWAEILLLVLVGILLPVEIFELFHRPNLRTLLIFVVNVAAFLYLLKKVFVPHHPVKSSAD